MVIFDSRADFSGAAMFLQTVDFEGLPLAPVFGTMIVGAVGFSGINGIHPATAPTLGYMGAGTALMNIGVPEISSIQVSLPAGVTAIGTDVLTSAFDNRSPVVISLSTGDVLTLDGATLSGRRFVGFASEVPIDSIRFSSTSSTGVGASRVGLDDFSTGQTGPKSLPEPSTGALLLSALFALRRASRKK